MGKQNYTEQKLAEAKRIRHKAWKDERDKRLAQSVADKEKNKDKKPEDWLSPRLKELRAKKKAQAKEQKAKQLAKQKEARLRLEKPKCPLKFLSSMKVEIRTESSMLEAVKEKKNQLIHLVVAIIAR